MTPVELLQQLIRFDTTNPPGNESECVGLVRNLLEEAGCETQTYAKDRDRPNLVARLPGAGDSPPLLLQGHVDVVTTAGQEWQRPPFGGDLVDGEIWGRGAVDMKGAVAMFDTYVREPLRAADLSDDERADRLVEAFRVLLPSVTALVAHHFRRVLLEVAQEHLESVGDSAELEAANAEASRRLEVVWP